MKFSRNKIFWAIAPILGLASYCITSYWIYPKNVAGVSIEEYHDPWYQMFNVHGNTSFKLRSGTHTFKGVRGPRPCYIDLPKIDAILFVQVTGAHHRSEGVLLYGNGNTIRFDQFEAPLGKYDANLASYSAKEIVLDCDMGDFKKIVYVLDIASGKYSKRYVDGPPP